MKITRREFAILPLAAATAGLSNTALAQAYPSKRISIIIGGGPGGGVDTITRLFARKLNERLSQPVVVENRTGAGASLAVVAVARAPADGYTLLISPDSALAIWPHVSKSVAYNSMTDLQPVSRIVSWPMVLIGAPSVPGNDVTELVVWLKQQRGKANYGSNGVGGIYQLAFEQFKTRAGVEITHVPYKEGDAAIVQSVRAGETQIGFVGLAAALPHLKAGTVKAFGVSAAQSVPQLPDVPAIAKALPGFVVMPWHGLFLPAQTPPAIVERLHAETLAILKDQDFAKRMFDSGFIVDGSTPQQLGELVGSDLKRYGEIVKTANIAPE